MINIILQKNFRKFYFIQRRYFKKKENTVLSTEKNRQTDGKECFFKFTRVKSSYVERTKQKSKAKHDLRYGPRITSQFPSFNLSYLPVQVKTGTSFILIISRFFHRLQ